ncbi:hypothetical protein CFOL_v3_30613 [Cephalotus follicularis]|uniref:Uncharacterized protein n=1 Tax=Cephalotus follicularis TaxID=3775 RepID=A0A1Q3D3U8_CEPFO|nr:hypothetical protein CFOL_v3_30613 [Cephalotus follicularis]
MHAFFLNSLHPILDMLAVLAWVEVVRILPAKTETEAPSGPPTAKPNPLPACAPITPPPATTDLETTAAPFAPPAAAAPFAPPPATIDLETPAANLKAPTTDLEEAAVADPEAPGAVGAVD